MKRAKKIENVSALAKKLIHKGSYAISQRFPPEFLPQKTQEKTLCLCDFVFQKIKHKVTKTQSFLRLSELFCL